jgi:hypothetical protein
VGTRWYQYHLSAQDWRPKISILAGKNNIERKQNVLFFGNPIWECEILSVWLRLPDSLHPCTKQSVGWIDILKSWWVGPFGASNWHYKLDSKDDDLFHGERTDCTKSSLGFCIYIFILYIYIYSEYIYSLFREPSPVWTGWMRRIRDGMCQDMLTEDERWVDERYWMSKDSIESIVASRFQKSSVYARVLCFCAGLEPPK